jgi:transketolase
LTCKIHITVDGLDNPLRYVLSAGHCHDIIYAYDLLSGFDFDRLIAG